MFELPSLNYDYDALEPNLSASLMHLHHEKHHQTYVNKLNETIAAFPELNGRSLVELLEDLNSLPEKARKPIINYGGGHYNHSLFWECLSPTGGGEPIGEVAELINRKYESVSNFVDQFTTSALGVFGSGWAYLMSNGDIYTTANQDTPMMNNLTEPILCLDVWEHAYYLDYQNRRDEYIKAWWNVVDWEGVERRFQSLKNKQ